MSVEARAFGGKRRLPWTKGRGIESVLAEWSNGSVGHQLVLDETLPARPSQAVEVPGDLDPAVRGALHERGITELYTHQARSLELARAGKDVVIATPTASGKSLCYNLPVLDRLAREPSARALYLFPTKALSRDQEHALRGFLGDAGLPHGAITFDGDTPGDARRAARERAGVLLSNPDMLHAGVLPHHASWARFFASLRYVVLDELHTYRGVFGSHLANVMRRLQRIARFHGADPQFILASATIGNPAEHASRIVGRPVVLVGESGAPTGERRVLVYNPPVINPEFGVRASYLKSAVRLTADLVRAEVPTLVFGQSRNGVEVMLKYLRDRLAKDVGHDAIHAYRGGYLPKQRRAIEQNLRDGAIKCVVATNALELGIDIGSLDAVVCAGYPGTLAGTWQRFGRAGRREGSSLSVLVTSSAPLDQYVASSPRSLMSAGVEHARIDPQNVEILLQHLKCAAFELPFEEGDGFGDVSQEELEDALGFLTSHHVVNPSPGPAGKTVWHWASDSYPANGVSLRAVGWDNFVIIDLDSDKIIAEMDWRSTHTMLHEQAIYQHAARQYQVERLDYENHKAYVREVKPDYYTTAMTHTKVTVLEEDEAAELRLPGATLEPGMGDVTVIQRVVGYKKIKFHTHENSGYGDVHLPEMQMHTTSFWLTFPERWVNELMAAHMLERADVVDGLRGILAAMKTVAVTGLMVDPRDLGSTLGDRSGDGEAFSPRGLMQPPPHSGKARDGAPPQLRSAGGAHRGVLSSGGGGFDPTLFLYDAIPGGVGLASRLMDERDSLLRRTRTLIDGCGCTSGCPACIGPDVGVPTGETGVRRHGRSDVAKQIFDHLGVPAVH